MCVYSRIAVRSLIALDAVAVMIGVNEGAQIRVSLAPCCRIIGAVTDSLSVVCIDIIAATEFMVRIAGWSTTAMNISAFQRNSW
jgi:hypothetical protein